MAPASTSPVPAVASAGFADSTTITCPSREAMTVLAPFRTTTAPHSRARCAACPIRSAWISATGRLVRRAISPGCGVSTADRSLSRYSRSASSSASMLSASASNTTPRTSALRWTIAAMKAPSAALPESPRPRPGPTSAAPIPRSFSRPETVCATYTASGIKAAAMVLPASGTARVTRPAPARYAAPAHSAGAPGKSCEPATIRARP